MFNFDPEKEFQFLGIFWLPNNPDNPFTGSLFYTPEDGVCLEIVAELKLENSFLLNEEKESYIFGHCNELGDVTLIYCAPNGYGISSVFYRKYQILYVLTNIHYHDNEAVFNKMAFHFKELNNFCSKNQDALSVISFNDVLSCDLDDNIHFVIRHGTRDGFMLNEILQTTFDDIDDEMLQNIRDKAGNLAISKPFFYIAVSKEKSNLSECLKLVHRFEKLFSVFLYQPVHMTYFSLRTDKDKHLLIWKPFKEQSKTSTIFYGFLPITLKNIKDKFPTIWKGWNETLQEIKYNTLVTDKFFGNVQLGYLSYGVVISAINEWQKKNGIEKREKLYENFLKESFCEDNEFNNHARKKIIELFGPEDFEKIGKKLTNLRGAFLHEARQIGEEEKKLLENDAAMRNLSELLFLILTRRVLLQIGVFFDENTNRFLCRKIPEWEIVSF